MFQNDVVSKQFFLQKLQKEEKEGKLNVSISSEGKRIFVLDGIFGKRYRVQLGSNSSCSCGTKKCLHIKIVKDFVVLEQLKNELAAVKDAMAQKDNEISLYKARVDQLEEIIGDPIKIKKLQRALKEAAGVITRNEIELAHYRAEIANLERLNKRLRSDASKMDEQADKLKMAKERIKEKDEKISFLEQRIIALEEIGMGKSDDSIRSETTENALKNAIIENRALTKKVSLYEERIAELEKKNEAVDSKVLIGLQRSLRDNTQANKQKDREIASLKQTITDLMCDDKHAVGRRRCVCGKELDFSKIVEDLNLSSMERGFLLWIIKHCVKSRPASSDRAPEMKFIERQSEHHAPIDPNKIITKLCKLPFVHAVRTGKARPATVSSVKAVKEGGVIDLVYVAKPVGLHLYVYTTAKNHAEINFALGVIELLLFGDLS